MSNRILRVELRNRTLVPAEAEVWVSVYAEAVTPATELRGRLMGPRCRYSNTVEVAYPLRPLIRPTPGLPPLTARVVVPEASFWDTQSPFLYQGPVELWQDGRRCDRAEVRHGFRFSSLGPRGLRWNGKPLPLRGRIVGPCGEDEMSSLRTSGFNLLAAPVTAGAAELWERADRLGLLMLGIVERLDESLLAPLATHPSCFGWAFEEATWRRVREGWQPVRGHVGLRLDTPPARGLPPGVEYIWCPAPSAPVLAELGVPLLLDGASAGAVGQEGAPVLGFVVE